MAQETKIEVLLFYSNHSTESQKTRIALHEFTRNNRRRYQFTVKEVNYDLERAECQLHGVVGTPTLLIYHDQELCTGYFGSLTYQDIQAIIGDYFDSIKSK